MRTVTSIPRIYADERGLKHKELTERLIGIFFSIYNDEVGLLFNFGPTAQFRRHVFENDRKNPRNPRESVDKKLPGSCG